MAKIIVYNNDTDRMETFYKSENDAMPYNTHNTLKVKEFRGSSKSDTLWTTKKAMQSWNSQRSRWGGPIPLGFAFKRPWEGGHSNQSQHYAGTSFDVGQRLTNEQRNKLRIDAEKSGLWSYVEPADLTPTWVHFDRRQRPPACGTGGYPALKEGSVSTYVLILQDSLNTAGFPVGSLDGYFGSKTKKAVTNFQKSKGLTADGVVGCNTWKALTGDVVGKGRTSTTVD